MFTKIVYLFIWLMIFMTNISCNELNNKLLYTIDNYVYLLRNIQNFYGTNGIYILYDDTQATDFFSITSIFGIVKNLSSEEIFTQAIKQSNLYLTYNKIVSTSSRQLFVLFLTNENNLKIFKDFSNDNNLSSHVWFVLFLNSSTEINSACENPKVDQFNLKLDSLILAKCYMNPTLNEWYYLGNNNKAEIIQLMEWEPKSGLVIKNHRSMFRRRYNFHGAIVKVSTVEESNIKFSERQKIYIKNFVLLYKKIMSDILGYLNITAHELLPSESNYGNYNKTEGKWTGFLGKLDSGEFDLAAVGIIRTSDRDEFFDLTWPLDTENSRIYLRQSLSFLVHWYGYLKSFSHDVWIALAAMIALSSLLLTIIKLQLKNNYSGRDLVLENYLHVWGIYCQQGVPDYPDLASLRVTFVTLFLSALVVLAYYSAYLISSLTIAIPELPFNTLEEFLNDGSFKLIVVQNKAEYDMFITTNNTLYQKMRKLLKDKKDLPVTNKDAVAQICKEGSAFYTSKTITNEDFAMPCNLIDFPVGKTRYYSFALKKRNPLTKFINYYIRRFEEHGLLKRIKNEYPLRDVNYTVKKFDSVNFWEIAPLLTILSLGMMLSIFIFCVECICHRTKIYSM